MTDIDFLIEENEKKPIEEPPRLISEYIDGLRIMPKGTPFPGPVDIYKAPYTIEIMDNMSPFSPIQEDSVMKGVQMCITWTAENIIGYWMKANPTEILYISATEGLLEIWSTKRLEPLIDSIGMRENIFAQAGHAKTRRTGDKIFSKEFVGGTLNMASAQSAGSLRSDSKRILIIDEMDGAPAQLRTGEGNYVDVAYGRTNAWGDRKKIIQFSTPTTFENSLIKIRYELGDQRKFFVPCPFCGKYQILEFKRLHPDTKAGILQNVYYQCEFCTDVFFNHHKSEFLKKGRWEPTTTSTAKFRVSRQIGSIYSPVGMLSWIQLYQKYLDTQDDPDAMRSFVNLYEGLPYQEVGSRPPENIIELRGAYNSRSIPDGVLYLVIGMDVQRGSKNDDTKPARLEMEVLGIGPGYRTWSIEYKVFLGKTDDAFDGAWENLNEWAMEGGLNYERNDGMKFTPSLIFIDSGDGKYVDVVYRFCSRWTNTFPIKGFGELTKRKKEKKEIGDEAGPNNFKRYRAARTERSGDVTFYEISTNHYKSIIYNALKITRQPIEPQRPGFCNFPFDYTKKYFEGLRAAEKRTDGSFHSGARADEPLDCRVYALCAADVFLDKKVYELREAAKASGMKSEMQLSQFNHRLVIDQLVKNTAIQKPGTRTYKLS